MENIKKQIIEIIKKWDNADIGDFIREIRYLNIFHDINDLPFLLELYKTAKKTVEKN